MSKLIFLDIDGVLNTQEHQRSLRAKGSQTSDEFGLLFAPEAVKLLKHIIDTTGADIILISSWKFLGIKVMQQMWLKRCMPGQLLDITDSSASDDVLLSIDLDDDNPSNLCKGIEVKSWLRQHKRLHADYVILDDEAIALPSQVSHFVQTQSERGLSERDAERAISILQGNNTSSSKSMP